MSRLVELMLDIEPAVSGRHLVHAILRECTSYPPRFQVSQGRVEEDAFWTLGGEVAADRMTRGFLLEGHLSLTFPLLLWEAMRPPEAGAVESSLSDSLGAVIRLARRFFQEARQARSSLYRLTVRSVLAEVLGFPWRSGLSLASPRHAEDALDTRIAVIARYPEPLAWRPALRLPLTLGISGRRERLTFDSFSQGAIRAGAFSVQYNNASSVGEGVHFIGEREGGTGALTNPRLLVLELQWADRLLSEGWVEELLRRGAGAILVIMGSKEVRRLFFQRFYREVLHNQPLEQCVREALAACPRWEVQVAFGAREGGEHGLLFTRAAVEASAAARDSLPIGGPESGSSETLESMESKLEQEGPVMEVSRIRRHLRVFQQALNASIRTTRDRIDAQVAELEGRTFDDDPRVLSEAVQSIRTLGSEAQRVWEQRIQRMNTAGLSDLLEEEEDRELQRGFTRLLNVWLSEGPGAHPVERTRPLTWGAHPQLHIKISPARVAEAFSARFPEFQMELAFGREPLRLEVCIFHDARSVMVEQPRGELLLPVRGESTEFRTFLRPQVPGTCRLRVCLFHRGTLLQSLVVEADVREEDAIAAPGTNGPAPIRYALDYVASPDFLLLEQYSRPVLSLVTNHSAHGDVWLGIFSSQEPGHGGLRAGTLHTFPEEQLSSYVQRVRKALRELQGELGNVYQGALDASNQAERAWGLVQLASHGARLYNGLFNGNLALSKLQLQSIHEGLRQPGLISIARCDLTEPSIPWALLYDLPLDTGNAAQLKLCPVFLKQLEAQEDRLDAPDSCRALPECPLRGAQARQTVCPFGFWGVHHQLEQPLKQIRVEDLQVPPSALTSPAFAESCQLLAHPAPPRAFMGCGSNVPAVEEHYQELHRLEGWTLARSDIREDVIEALEREPELLYLYCHGKQDEGVFKLGFQDAFIEATSLQPNWERQPFFVFLNACDSVATLPETLHTFLGTLIHLGALAVIGSEIQINSLFARQFARRVLEDFLAGDTLGRAFLRARRHFLRQLNPLALAYTLHAAADVHLHGEGCGHCASGSPAV